MSTPIRLIAATLLAVSTLAFSPALRAQEDQPLTPKQQDAVKKLVHDYLIENPQILAEAIEALREKEQLAAEAEAKKALTERKDQIFSDAATPALGNPAGDVTVVEFFDYRCPYCKTMADGLLDTIKADGKVRLLMKELPVLGPDSVFAARAALASVGQKKYEAFHRALMHVKGPLNETVVMKVAGDTGLDVAKLKKDMDDEAIKREIAANIQLASALGLNGTPALIVGEQVVPGAISAQSLKQLIDQVRHPPKN